MVKRGSIYRIRLGKGTAFVAAVDVGAKSFRGRRWFPASSKWGTARRYDVDAVIEEADYNDPEVARALVGLMGVIHA